MEELLNKKLDDKKVELSDLIRCISVNGWRNDPERKEIEKRKQEAEKYIESIKLEFKIYKEFDKKDNEVIDIQDEINENKKRLITLEDKIRYSKDDFELGKLTECRNYVKDKIISLETDIIIIQDKKENEDKKIKTIMYEMFEVKIVKNDCIRYYYPFKRSEKKFTEFYDFLFSEYNDIFIRNNIHNHLQLKYILCKHINPYLKEIGGIITNYEKIDICKDRFSTLYLPILMMFVVLFKTNIVVLGSIGESIIIPHKNYPFIYFEYYQVTGFEKLTTV